MTRRIVAVVAWLAIATMNALWVWAVGPGQFMAYMYASLAAEEQRLLTTGIDDADLCRHDRHPRRDHRLRDHRVAVDAAPWRRPDGERPCSSAARSSLRCHSGTRSPAPWPSGTIPSTPSRTRSCCSDPHSFPLGYALNPSRGCHRVSGRTASIELVALAHSNGAGRDGGRDGPHRVHAGPRPWASSLGIPLGSDALPAWVWSLAWPLAGLGGVLISALGAAAVVTRYRRSVGAERQQLRWFVAAVLSGGCPDHRRTPGRRPDRVPALPYSVYSSSPSAIWIAVMRYRLFEIDLIISRGLSWALLSGLLVAVYAGGIILLQSLLGSVTQGETVAVAGSTLLAAALSSRYGCGSSRWSTIVSTGRAMTPSGQPPSSRSVSATRSTSIDCGPRWPRRPVVPSIRLVSGLAAAPPGTTR